MTMKCVDAPIAEVRRAVEHATEFILNSRDQEGWWLDYDIHGPSDVWVSSYVGAAVSSCSDARLRRAATQAWDLISSTPSPSGGWAYISKVPGDADSTAWALRLAEATSRSSATVSQEGYTFLLRHLQRDGGLATFQPDIGGVLFGYTKDASGSWLGYCTSHTCVTAAAAMLHDFPARSALLEYLRREQSPSGAWNAYWWPDAEYASALAYEALYDVRATTESCPNDQGRLETASRWAASRVDSDGAVHTSLDPIGSPFATACALRILSKSTRSDETDSALHRCLSWLMASQKSDGSWDRTARMRIPPYDMVDPSLKLDWGHDGRGDHSIGTIVVDTHAIFTTATVVQALLTWLETAEPQ